jgi:hypothetical protein
LNAKENIFFRVVNSKNVMAIDKELSIKLNEAPANAGALDYERSC